MGTVALIALGIFAIGLALTWIAGRFISERAGVIVSILNALFLRLAVLFFLLWGSVRFAHHGALGIALVVLVWLVVFPPTVLQAAKYVFVLHQVLTEGLDED